MIFVCSRQGFWLFVYKISYFVKPKKGGGQKTSAPPPRSCANDYNKDNTLLLFVVLLFDAYLLILERIYNDC